MTITSVGGKDFDPAATYTIATNDFMASGGNTYYRFINATANYDLGIAMDEVVMDYITTVLGGTVTADKYGEPRRAHHPVPDGIAGSCCIRKRAACGRLFMGRL